MFPGRQQDIDSEQDPTFTRHRSRPAVALHRPSYREDNHLRVAYPQA